MISISIYWLIFGILCFALEALGMTGVGLFFAGLGSVVVAVIIESGLVGEQAYISQFAWFFALTVLWAAVLWKPIKNYRMHKKGADYSNMVGDYCKVAEIPLVKGKRGKVKWSGTTMIAELAEGSAAEVIAVDEDVVIKEVKGTTLYVDKA